MIYHRYHLAVSSNIAFMSLSVSQTVIGKRVGDADPPLGSPQKAKHNCVVYKRHLSLSLSLSAISGDVGDHGMPQLSVSSFLSAPLLDVLYLSLLSMHLD